MQGLKKNSCLEVGAEGKGETKKERSVYSRSLSWISATCPLLSPHS